MKVDTIQTSFAGGEIAPALYGRTDIAQYALACAEIQNWLVRPFGSVISTPGTEFINACKTGGTTSAVRLINFVFSRTDSYIIEMGVGYFRFYTNGGVVVSSGTTPYEVAHTYTADELFDVQYSQLNDIIYLTHPDHAPQKLTRLASNSWTLEDFDFEGGPFMPDNIAAITLTPSATGGSITVSATASVFTPSGATTVGHINSYWKIGTNVTEATTGISKQGYVKITAITNPSTATATVMSDLSGTKATKNWAEGSWSAVRGWPARVTFHQQRLFLARTASEPQTVWGSQSFVYNNFAVNDGSDDSALNLELASNESNDIKWLASGKSLIAGTYGGEYSIQSGDNAPLTPATTNVSKQTSWGSEAIIPKKIGSYYYYIQRFGKKLRELFYFWDEDNYKSVDKTILSPHISGDGFIDMAYQQNPDSILWCVCSNGTIATLTREVDQEIQAWSRQVTDGYYESIATIPSQTEPHDEVWVVVKRAINGSDVRYIERFVSPEIPERQDQCFYVHSGLVYDGYGTTADISLSATAGTVVVTSSTAAFTTDNEGNRLRAIDTDGNIVGEILLVSCATTTVIHGEVRYPFEETYFEDGEWGISVETISGLDHLEGKDVSVLVDGGTDLPSKTVSSGTITLGYDGFYVVAGLPYIQKLKTLPQEAGSQRGTSQGKIQRINELGFKVNKSYKGFYVGGSEEDLLKVRYATSEDSDIIYEGEIPNDRFSLKRISFRDPTTLLGKAESLYTGIIPNISFQDGYRYGSQVLIYNDAPLPIELLSLITTIDTNDK